MEQKNHRSAAQTSRVEHRLPEEIKPEIHPQISEFLKKKKAS